MKLNIISPTLTTKKKNSSYIPRDWFLNSLKNEFNLTIYTKTIKGKTVNKNKIDESIKVISFFESVSYSHLLKNYFYYRKRLEKVEKQINFIFYPLNYTGILLGLMLRDTNLVIWVKGDPSDHSLKRYTFRDYQKYLYFFIRPVYNFAYISISKFIFKKALVFYTANTTINRKNHINQHEIISNSAVNRDPKLVKKHKTNKIFFVGNENRQKGLVLLLKALQYSDKELHIIGLDELKDKEHIKLVKNVKVKIHGTVHDRKKYYELLSQGDVVVMPSYGEKQGKIQLEAMSVGVVPICSDSGGTYQTIHNYYNGLLFKEGDWKGLKQKLEEVYTNKRLYLDLQENGLEYIKTQSVEKQAKLMAKVIKNYYNIKK